MCKRLRRVALLALLSSVSSFGVRLAAAQDVVSVAVINFPETQQVEGEVQVTSPTPHSRLVRQLAVVVPPSSRAIATELVPGAILDTAGFTEVVLSLQGVMSDQTFRPGSIGVLLIPDEEAILEAFTEYAQYLFTLETAAQVTPAPSPHFASQQRRQSLGFPSYRVFFYNSTNRSAEVNLFAYLLQ